MAVVDFVDLRNRRRDIYKKIGKVFPFIFYLVRNFSFATTKKGIMIECISIKNVATFQNDGICLQKLKPINFIYGANGSGKTTISNFLQRPDDPIFSSCKFHWQNESPLRVLVYNKRFRDDNFGKGKLAGIFTLGYATKEELLSIEKMNSDLSAIMTQKTQKKETLDKFNNGETECVNNFKESIWQAGFKKNEHVFKEALRGFIGSKDTFRDKIMEKFQTASTVVKTRGELEKAAQEILSKGPQHALELMSPPNITHLITTLCDAIWMKKIIGKSDVEIAKLIQHLNMNDWVNKGRSYIQEDTDICPFCQKKQ
ncbi:MAG: AAA family ATPase [Evtepia sp.]